MKKIRIGIWLIPGYRKDWGGAYNYYVALIDAIQKHNFQRVNIVFICDEYVEINAHFEKINWTPNSYLLRLKKGFKVIPGKIGRKIQTWINRKVAQHDELLVDELNSICDVIYYPIPMCKYPEFPFVYTLWDIGHLNSYNLPSLSGNELYDKRRLSYEVLPSKALLVICESEAGKRELVHYLRFNKQRIRVLPLFPSDVISKNSQARKPEKIDDHDIFIHYPAQFWAHKNHYNLLLAFSIVLKEFPYLKLIFTGSDQGNKEYILDCIDKLQLDGRVVDLGFVSQEELNWLYQNSKGLVMPTLLGPTNMPPLEALMLNCPVAVSELPGHREQLGEYALYFDPLNCVQMAGAITDMLSGKAKSKKDFASSIPTPEKNMATLEDIFDDVASLRLTWK